MSLNKLAKIAIAETVVNLAGLVLCSLGMANCSNQPLNEMLRNPYVSGGAVVFYGTIAHVATMAVDYDKKHRASTNRNV